MMVDIFARLGLGQGFRYVTAAVEVIGGVGLLIPRFTAKAALLLAVTMTCAVVAHLTVLGGKSCPGDLASGTDRHHCRGAAPRTRAALIHRAGGSSS